MHRDPPVGEPLCRYDQDDYALLLMNVISLQFKSHGWTRSLLKVGLDPEDVAQDLVRHLLRKTKTMEIRAIADGYRPLLTFLNQAIKWFVITQIQSRERKGARELAATDYYTDRGRPADEAGHEPPPLPEPVDQEHLNAVLEECEDAVIGDVVTANAREFDALERAFVLMRDALLEKHAVPPHRALPYELRMEVSIELHGLVAARLYRVVRAYGSI
jgi:hypothetical protein